MGDDGNPTRTDGGIELVWTDRMVLEFDRATFRLNVGGHFGSLDIAMAMLQQATRAIEQQLKLAAVAQFQQKQADAALAAQVREGLKRRQ